MRARVVAKVGECVLRHVRAGDDQAVFLDIHVSVELDLDLIDVSPGQGQQLVRQSRRESRSRCRYLRRAFAGCSGMHRTKSCRRPARRPPRAPRWRPSWWHRPWRASPRRSPRCRSPGSEKLYWCVPDSALYTAEVGRSVALPEGKRAAVDRGVNVVGRDARSSGVVAARPVDLEGARALQGRKRRHGACRRKGVDRVGHRAGIDRRVGIENHGRLRRDHRAGRVRRFRADRVVDEAQALGRNQVGWQEAGQRIGRLVECRRIERK